MQARDTALFNYGTITANAQSILQIQNKDLSVYTYTLNGLSTPFTGTVVIQVLDGDVASGTWNAPTTMTWTQPAAFTGTQIVVLTITGNFAGLRLTSTAFTSGTLKATLVAK